MASAIDLFAGYLEGLSAPYANAADVTPSDTADLTYTTRALYVGTTGNLVVIMASGDTVTLDSVPVGVLPIRVSRVKATNTTAANIVALW